MECTPFLLACGSGELLVAKRLAELGAICYKKTRQRENALHLAIMGGHVNLTHWFLNGLDPNGERMPCLQDREKDAFFLNTILNAGDHSADTPLHYACRFGLTSVLHHLLEIDALAQSAHQNDTKSKKASKAARGLRQDQRMLRVDVEARNRAQNTALMIACERGNSHIAVHLLEHLKRFYGFGSGKIMARGSRQMSAMHHACHNSLERVSLLLLREYGSSALMQVWRCTSRLAFRALTSVCEQMNESQQTPLHLACKAGHTNLVDVILKQPKADAVKGVFLVGLARAAVKSECKRDSLALQLLLRLTKSELTQQAADDLRALAAWAAENGRADFALSIVNHFPAMFKVSRTTHSHQLLHHACAIGSVALVERILAAMSGLMSDKKSSSLLASALKEKNVENRTPLQEAIHKKQVGVILLLMRHEPIETRGSLQPVLSKSCSEGFLRVVRWLTAQPGVVVEVVSRLFRPPRGGVH